MTIYRELEENNLEKFQIWCKNHIKKENSMFDFKKTYFDVQKTEKSYVEKSKKDLVKDIVAFNNNDGGYIIYGIDENSDQIFFPLYDSFDKKQCQINDIIKSNTDPQLINIKHFKIDDNEKYYHIIKIIPLENNEICGYIGDGVNSFYYRQDGKKVSMPTYLISKKIKKTYDIKDENKKHHYDLVNSCLRKDPIIIISIYGDSEKNLNEIYKIFENYNNQNSPFTFIYCNTLNFNVDKIIVKNGDFFNLLQYEDNKIIFKLEVPPWNQNSDVCYFDEGYGEYIRNFILFIDEIFINYSFYISYFNIKNVMARSYKKISKKHKNDIICMVYKKQENLIEKIITDFNRNYYL